MKSISRKRNSHEAAADMKGIKEHNEEVYVYIRWIKETVMGLLDKLFGKKKDKLFGKKKDNSSAETAIPEAELERYQGSDTEVQVPDCVDGYKVVRIGDYCFARCSFITSVALPDTVKNIGEGVFSGCSSLTSITLPDSLTMIGEGVFER